MYQICAAQTAFPITNPEVAGADVRDATRHFRDPAHTQSPGISIKSFKHSPEQNPVSMHSRIILRRSFNVDLDAFEGARCLAGREAVTRLRRNRAYLLSTRGERGKSGSCMVGARLTPR